MRVKIWGARGSVPTPAHPEEIREKIVSAVLGISQIKDGEFREELLAAILEDPPPPEDQIDPLSAAADKVAKNLAKRRKVVEAYLDGLSPLAGSTAGGNTSCIEIQTGEDLFIIDAGSGIRDLGLKLMAGECGQGKGIIHLLFSHPHWDHIQGFPFFRPAFVPGNQIFIYSTHDMETALRRQQESISFPVSLDYMQAEMTFIPLKPEETLEFGDLRIRILKNHHPGDSYAFRFEKGNKAFVYASDAGYPGGIDLRPHLNFFAEADVLFFDAQFTQRESDEKEDWGHSSSFVGVEMAQQARVKTLVLYHYDPTYTDKDLEKILQDTLTFQQSQYPDQEPVEILIAREGQTFDLTSHYVAQLRQIPGSKAVLLKPSGIFDEQVVNELQEQFLKIKNANELSHLIIDMTDVDMLQVTGLRALVKFKKEQPGTIVALAGPATKVQQLIELAGYLDFFPIHSSVHAALSTLQAHETLNLPGQLLKNRYFIEAKMGDGRLGTVFKATDTRLNRTVAIKILSPYFSEGAIEQFLQHGRQIVDLVHPNIVSVYDCDEDHGLYFMVEELIENKTLREVIDEHPDRPPPLNVALSIAENIARALEYAHARGVIHGDLKPKNVLLADQVKISDFGLGRLESGQSLLNTDKPLALVTAHYLAPEQVLGHPIDARTDLYALGVILYELFTGRRPFEGSDQEVLEHHRSSKPRPPRLLNPGLSYSLEHLILKLLDKDPNKRYVTARQTRRILSSMTTLTSGEAQPHLFTPQSRLPLIGRKEALEQLLALWSETTAGQGQLVFISGETGIGKSRLGQELAQHINNGTLLIGHGQKPESSAPYQPFLEALRAYFANARAGKMADTPVGQFLGGLAPIIPEISPLFPDLPAPEAGAASPTLEFPGLAHLLAQATADRPWLLLLDDLHLSDQSTFKLLHYLARHCAQMRLMIVGLYQDSEGQDNHFLAETLAELQQQIRYTSLALKPFAEAEVTELLNHLWSQTVPPDLAASIFRRSQGNPFFVEEIARALMDENVVSWRARKWHFVPVVEVNLPRHIRDAILRRLNRLPKDTLTLLSQAAILGSTFTFDDLQAISGFTKKEILEGLDIALERQLISQAPSESVLRFSHTEIQQTLYQNLSVLKRRQMHGEAGAALEQQHRSNLDPIAEKLAYHFFQAGVLEKGVIYSIRAAGQADAHYAYHNALSWHTQALEALEQLGADSQLQSRQFEVLLAREQIYDRIGDRPAQAADLASLESLTTEGGDDPAQKAVVQNRRASFMRLTGHLEQAATHALAATEAARRGNNSLLEAEGLMQLAQLACEEGKLETARTQFHKAEAILKLIDAPEQEARCFFGLSTVYRYLNNYSQASDYCQQGLTLNQTLGSWPGRAAGFQCLGSLHLEVGDYTLALSRFYQALEINRIIGDRRSEAICLNKLAATRKEIGHLKPAEDYIKGAIRLHQACQDQAGEAGDLLVKGTLYLVNGDYSSARDHAGEALEIFQRLGSGAWEGRTWLELGLAQESLGDLNKAAAAYHQAQTIQQAIGSKAGQLDARAGVARCLLAEGKTDLAKMEVESTLAKIKEHGTTGIKYPIRLYLTAYWVLQAAGHKKQALNALREGYNLLQKRADTIADPHLQALYLEKVPENKELVVQLRQHDRPDSSVTEN